MQNKQSAVDRGGEVQGLYLKNLKIKYACIYVFIVHV